MTRYILGRLLGILAVLLVVSIMIFLMMHTIPGGPFDNMPSTAEHKAIPEHIRQKLLAKEAIGVFLFNPVQATLYKGYVAGIPLTKDGTLGVYNMMIPNEIYVKQH